MFGAVIDTAIGIVLVFLLFSILLSTLMEAISGALNLRAKAFENAVANLIENPQNVQGAFNLFGKITGMFTHKAAAISQRTDADTPYTNIYCHALVAGISGTSKPSYVPAANFASAVIDELNGPDAAGAAQAIQANIAALPDGDFKQMLTALQIQAAGSLDKLQAGIEGWYDSAMDRVSGDYKRFTQVITFGLGLLIAGACNIDAINVGKSLYADPTLRTVVEQSAEKQAAGSSPAKPQATDFAAVRVAQAQLLELAPIGWRDSTMAFSEVSDVPQDAGVVIGWLLTAVAGLMGAPFWFDTLKSLVNVRNAGPKPASSTSDAK